MINIQKTGNAIVVDFTDNDKYLNNGTIEVAPNELMVVIDESNMATFKKMSNGDTLFGQLIDQIQIQGENVTKDNIIEKFGIIGFSISGEGAVSSVNGQTGDVVITATSLGAITKADADDTYASKTELEEKQDTLVSGTNIKTINYENLLGSGNIKVPEGDTSDFTAIGTSTNATNSGIAIGNTTYASNSGIAIGNNIIETEYRAINIGDRIKADRNGDFIYYDSTSGHKVLKDELAKKQDTLVSGTSIKTINGESILGAGNIAIQGGSEITVDTEMSDTSENPVQNKVIKAYIDSLVGNILTQLQEINGTN